VTPYSLVDDFPKNLILYMFKVDKEEVRGNRFALKISTEGTKSYPAVSVKLTAMRTSKLILVTDQLNVQILVL
jgi:hypothetical protein